MTKHNFTQKEIFTNAWNKLQAHAWYLFTIYFIAAVIMSAVSRAGIIQFAVCVGLSIALLGVTLKLIKGDTPTYQDLLAHFKNYKTPLHYTLATIAYTLILLAGFGATVATLSVLAAGFVPGALFTAKSYVVVALASLFLFAVFYFAMRFQFYKFLVIEHENMTAIQSLKKSMEITRGHFLKITGFFVSLLVLNIIGALSFGIGLIVTIPLSVTAYTLVYKKLVSEE
jgi:hypothetical protein